ncbi:hypothetical protein RND81_13G137100 [Saponaria officinalis]|uniref:Transposase n=1 Tax=Saponaria officinalis TaxID=3572 RepID=A0AAW1H0D9_SAPOF
MKLKHKQAVAVEHQNDKKAKRYEIDKAVAQAWHSHFNNDKVATCENDARRRDFKGKPSRFKLESTTKDVTIVEGWCFKESLWDSYEIVAVSKRLETGLVLGYDNSCDLEKLGEYNRVFRRPKESKNSLRNLFNGMSSRRFNDVEVTHQESC